MAQYCRYCANMYCGDSNYCDVKKRCFSDAYIKHTNRCKDFELNPLDALGMVHYYKPRMRGKTYKIYGKTYKQITLDEVEQ